MIPRARQPFLPPAHVRVFFSGLRIYEAIGVTSTYLESYSQSTAQLKVFGKRARSHEGLHLSTAQPK